MNIINDKMPGHSAGHFVVNDIHGFLGGGLKRDEKLKFNQLTENQDMLLDSRSNRLS